MELRLPPRFRIHEPLIKIVRGVSRVRNGASTVGAAVAVINRDGHVLMVRNRYRKGYGLPGGIARRGETPVAAAMRELSEETSVSLDFSKEKPVVLPDKVYPHFHFLFRTEADVTPARPQKVWVRLLEVAECRWVQPDSPVAVHLHRGASEQLRALGIDGF